MARNLTDEDVDALSKALGKQINSRAPTSSGSANLNIPGTNQQLNIFDKALDSAGKGSEILREAYGRVEKSILEGMDTWRNRIQTKHRSCRQTDGKIRGLVVPEQLTIC